MNPEGYKHIATDFFLIFLVLTLPWERPLTPIWACGTAKAPSHNCGLLKKILSCKAWTSKHSVIHKRRAIFAGCRIPKGWSLIMGFTASQRSVLVWQNCKRVLLNTLQYNKVLSTTLQQFSLRGREKGVIKPQNTGSFQLRAPWKDALHVCWNLDILSKQY